MIKHSVNITIGGEAGDGILSAGEILCKIFFATGLGLCTYKNFPSRIRGGHTAYSIRIADSLCESGDPETDILLVFDEESFAVHNRELKDGSIVIYDSTKVKNVVKVDKKVDYYAVAISEMAVSKFAKPMYKNTITVGFIAAILGLNEKAVEDGLEKSIKSKKGEDVFKTNLEACRFGANYYKNELKGRTIAAPSADHKNVVMMTGNEAIILGALTAGCKFAAAYPISPATEIFEALCTLLPKNGGTVMQAEDEISAICSAIGAGFAGARSMTSTSGPGISLMAEALGLAACAEVPVVIVNVQRPGPSTGLPTKTEQGDFYHALFSTHGDIPRIVLMAGDVNQCFDFTVKAFNLAEVYQCPVILLSEQALGQNKFVAPALDFSTVEIDRGKLKTEEELSKPDYKFLRYGFTADGVSDRAIPGQAGGVHIASGNEHLESGRITERPDIRIKITDKRMKKIEEAKNSRHLPKPVYFGAGCAQTPFEKYSSGSAQDARPSDGVPRDESSPLGIICAGHNAGIVREALEILAAGNGPKFAVMQITSIMPLPADEISKFASGKKKVLVIENNFSGQLANIIKMHIPIHDKISSILKYDGIAFSAKEIAAKLSEVCAQN